jgi:hypothetical protein
MANVDFAEVRRRVSVQRVLEYYGYPATREPCGQYRSGCPVHRSGSKLSRSVTTNGEKWTCHKCNRYGDVIDLVALMESKGYRMAAVKACAIVGSNVPYLVPQADLFSARTGNGEEARS